MKVGDKYVYIGGELLIEHDNISNINIGEIYTILKINKEQYWAYDKITIDDIHHTNIIIDKGHFHLDSFMTLKEYRKLKLEKLKTI